MHIKTSVAFNGGAMRISRPNCFDITHADGSKAFSGVCLWVYESVCLCVCLSVRMITQKRIIQSAETWSYNWYHFVVKTSKGQSQGHRVTKCKKAIEWPAWVMHSIECPVSSMKQKPFLLSLTTVQWCGLWTINRDPLADQITHSPFYDYKYKQAL